ncbi:peptidylprolyl isomerase [Puniceicoccaceae bacterium K14]|nr:peptidylprolyl isomerase [Puniceicoccaceae bacterium K14]
MDIEVDRGTAETVIELRDHFTINVEGPIAQFDTYEGELFVELLSDEAPLTVQNFLNYVERGDYDESIFHRLIHGFILQGGGFVYEDTDTLFEIAEDSPVVNEFGVSNTEGTIAMAKLGGDPDSATSQWFFNLADNSENLDNQNGGFTVFGNVLGDGISILDDLEFNGTGSFWMLVNSIVNGELTQSVPTFQDFPLRSTFDGTSVLKDDFLLINSVKEVGVYPGDHGNGSLINFQVTSDNEALVQASLEGTQLTLSFSSGVTGQAGIEISLFDAGLSPLVDDFSVNVHPIVPTVISQPSSEIVSEFPVSLSLEVDDGGAEVTYRWFKDGEAIENSDSSVLSVFESGLYHAEVFNSVGSVISSSADIEFAAEITSHPIGRTIEVGTTALLHVGTNANIEEIEFQWYKDGELIENSDSSEILVAESGSYTVTILGDDFNLLSNEAKIEVVDSLGQLVNVSTRGYVGTGHQAMIAGVVVHGSEEKNLLFRGVSESLASSGLEGLLADSFVAVYDGGTAVGSNDNWDESSVEDGMQALFNQIGAGAYIENSKDSALLYSMTEGLRTLILNGVDETEGLALVEVYDADSDISSSNSRIVNLSTRAMVKEGDGVAIVGFVIGGEGPMNVLIRGGSEHLEGIDVLVDEPILANPNLAVVSNNEIIAQNFDWDDQGVSDSLIAIQEEVGATPFIEGSGDSLLYLTLEPGIYSAILGGGEGLALVEIYEVR